MGESSASLALFEVAVSLRHSVQLCRCRRSSEAVVVVTDIALELTTSYILAACPALLYATIICALSRTYCRDRESAYSARLHAHLHADEPGPAGQH